MERRFEGKISIFVLFQETEVLLQSYEMRCLFIKIDNITLQLSP